MNTNDLKPAAVCPYCRRTLKVTADGRMSRHGFKRSNSGSTGRCEGSGRTVKAAAYRRARQALADRDALEAKRCEMANEGRNLARISRQIVTAERLYEAAMAALEIY